MSESTQNIIPSLAELLKLEHLVASTGFSLLPKQPVHSILAGKHTSKLRGRGLDFEEVRKYVAGDDIRNIDWRVTARTQVTSTKVFTEEKEKPVLVVTDTTAGMFFGSQVYTKSFIAAQLVAIAAFKVLKNGDRFGGLVFSDNDYKLFTPQRSRKVIIQYLQKLIEDTKATVLHEKKIIPKAENIDKALLRTVSMATHDFLIMVVSDFKDITAKSKKHLIQLSKHNDVILSCISDPLEEKLPDDKLVLSDGDLQLLWNSQKRKAGNKYTDAYQMQKRDFLDSMEKYGIPVLQLNTVEPIDVQLKALFMNKLKVKKV
jgi:uncharacterized protein (DUF58 family)